MCQHHLYATGISIGIEAGGRSHDGRDFTGCNSPITVTVVFRFDVSAAVSPTLPNFDQRNPRSPAGSAMHSEHKYNQDSDALIRRNAATNAVLRYIILAQEISAVGIASVPGKMIVMSKNDCERTA